MPSALTPTTANHISNFARSAKRTRKQWCLCALALVLALATILPAAQAQTLTVLHSFTQVKDGGFPSGTLVNDRAGNLYGTTQFGGRGFGSGTVFKLAGNRLGRALHRLPVLRYSHVPVVRSRAARSQTRSPICPSSYS